MEPGARKPAPPDLFVYDQIAWDDVLRSAAAGTAPPAALVERARATGARRKKVVRGQGGFFMNRSVLPAGFRVPPHAHDHDELIVVLRGGCRLDDGAGELGADDAIVLHAHHAYGFTCGPEGMEFLTLRRGEAGTSLSGGDP